MPRIYEDIVVVPNEGDVEGISISGDRFCYSGFECTEIPEDLLRYTELASSIDLSHNKIKEITEIGKFEKLEELNLDNNDVDDETRIPTMPSLTTLSLNKNNLVDCEKLVRQLRENCPNLKYLSLLGNEACPHPLLGYSEEEYQQARRFIASHIPTLETIDFEDVTDDERWSPVAGVEAFEETGADPRQDGESQRTSEPQASAGKVRYIYVGKQSEGNRFIRNNQL